MYGIHGLFGNTGSHHYDQDLMYTSSLKAAILLLNDFANKVSRYLTTDMLLTFHNTEMEHFDAIIVGTGQATGTLLSRLLETDSSIAVIEGGRIGGTCVNVGCTPTKTLVASARVVHVARRAAEYGVKTGEVEVDFTQVMARMNAVRGKSHQGLKEWLESSEQVRLYHTWATFESAKRLRVGDEVISGDKIFINVGGRARVPDIAGLDHVSWLDNSSVLELTALPEHLLIVGGGYIGLEFAQIFKRLGSKVTVIHSGEQIMNREDRDIAEAAQQILEDEGIRFELEASPESVYQEATKGIRLRLTSGQEIVGSHLLLATGRVPNTDRLGLDKAGIEVDKRGYIRVDDYCQTTVPDVFALGDVNGQGAFTHTSVNDAEIVLDYLHGGPRKLSDRIPIYAMFIDPALGRVGLSEKEALAKGHRVLKGVREMSQISRAKEMGETKGFVKLLVDADTDLILGGAILGINGDEVINMFAAYMYSGLPCKTYRKAVLVHPTVSELMPWILDNLELVEA